MHIPQSMLQGSICPVTTAVALAGVGSAIYLTAKSDNQVPVARWAGVTCLIAMFQMLNFPITNGTSGHLLGGILAVGLLGIPRAVLTMAMVIVAQAYFLGDGGVDALGANVVNMALLGTGIGGLLLMALERRGISKNTSMVLASLVSVVLAALACSVEVAISSVISLGAMMKAMLPVHILIGGAEAVLTVVLYQVLSRVLDTRHQGSLVVRAALCSLVLLSLMPLSSSLPDGFQSAAIQLKLISPTSI